MDPMRPTGLPDPEAQPEFYAEVPVKRALAWLVDFVVIMALVLPALVFTAFVGVFFLPFLFAAVGFIYRVATIAGGSATWGMRLMAIEFRDGEGRRLDTGQAFLHTLGYTVSVAVMPVQLVSVICMATTRQGQGLTDMVLGTTALNRRTL